MLVHHTHYHTVWFTTDPLSVHVIDQRQIPFAFTILSLRTVADVALAIAEMVVRGAGCIGATAGYGMILAVAESAGNWAELTRLGAVLKVTRPTAVNLAYAVDRVLSALPPRTPGAWLAAAHAEAEALAVEDVAACRSIGQHGLRMIQQLRAAQGRAADQPTNVLTHCNAGWLAFVDIGSATAPIYAAHDAGIPIHVWVDETRPRNQGARLTAWELAQHGVPHTVIADNAGGHLMQHGQVDLVITGADRVTRAGDAANKIGTYLKALAAQDNRVPFYIALPSSTFDWRIRDGLREIPIEEHSPREMTHLLGRADADSPEQAFAIISPGSPAANPAFDVTPARLITALITERGLVAANEDAITALFPN